MVVIRISEATNHQLDWLVAKAQSAECGADSTGAITATLLSPNITFLGTLTTVATIKDKRVVIPGGSYSPSTRWEQGGPLMERMGIEPAKLIGRQVGCSAFMNNDVDAPENLVFMYGNTYLQASMRCYAANHFGVTAEIPDELI